MVAGSDKHVTQLIEDKRYLFLLILFRNDNSLLIVGRYIQVNISRRGGALAPPIDQPPLVVRVAGVVFPRTNG